MTVTRDLDALRDSLLQRARSQDGSLHPLNRQTFALPQTLASSYAAECSDWDEMQGTPRMWAGDASLWTGGEEARWLGWLDLVADFFRMDEGADASESLATLAAQVHQDLAAEGDTDQALEGEESPRVPSVVLLGMGGSSLGPEVLSQVLARQRPLHVLDTTDPAQIVRVEQMIDLDRSLFIVSSKSGGTLETNLLFDYFYGVLQSRAPKAVPPEQTRSGQVCDDPNWVGRRFVVVTDPGSSLEAVARERGIARVFHGVPTVGGRYSVLSNFGLVPAAAIGIDTRLLMQAAVPMMAACTRRSSQDNPAVQLGLLLASAAQEGRDKVTFMASEALGSFGAWAEQLLAESTGHGGKGLIPVDGEQRLSAAAYGTDRIFVALELQDGNPDNAEEKDALSARIEALVEAGHPVIRITVGAELQDVTEANNEDANNEDAGQGPPAEYAVAQELVRWQFATAVVGSRLGVNPFVQPDVEAAKISSRRLTDAYERTGALPEEEPFVLGNTAMLFADAENLKVLQRPGDATVAEVLAAHLARVEPGDYVAILAFMDRSAELEDLLQAMRGKIAQHRGVATCLGFGPRFLHSTGQAYKGGPNTGVFLQFTHAEEADLEIPGRDFSFGVAKAAQARGDFEVLVERRRRLLRVHFTGKLVAGLQRIDGLIGRALQGLET